MHDYTIIVDSDSLIALLNSNDTNHKRSQEIFLELTTLESRLYYPTTMIAEVLTTLKLKLESRMLIEKVLHLIENNAIPLLEVSDSTINRALDFFDASSSKKNTFFDAIVAACAKDMDTNYILSFDKWYQTKGFTLIPSLLQKTID